MQKNSKSVNKYSSLESPFAQKGISIMQNKMLSVVSDLEEPPNPNTRFPPILKPNNNFSTKNYTLDEKEPIDKVKQNTDYINSQKFNRHLLNSNSGEEPTFFANKKNSLEARSKNSPVEIGSSINNNSTYNQDKMLLPIHKSKILVQANPNTKDQTPLLDSQKYSRPRIFYEDLNRKYENYYDRNYIVREVEVPTYIFIKDISSKRYRKPRNKSIYSLRKNYINQYQPKNSYNKYCECCDHTKNIRLNNKNLKYAYPHYFYQGN